MCALKNPTVYPMIAMTDLFSYLNFDSAVN